MAESCSRHEFKKRAEQITAPIPACNQEKYVQRFFSSIKKLLENECQIDISDNCSTDRSLRKNQAFAEQQLEDQIRLFRRTFEITIRKIQKTHFIAPLHGNNGGEVAKDGVPELLEISFIKGRPCGIGKVPALPNDFADSCNIPSSKDDKIC